MSWRPEGWKTPNVFSLKELKADRVVTKEDVRFISKKESKAYEAGADAMLEALKKEGSHFDRGEWTDDATFEVEVPGTVVFIPDDKEDNMLGVTQRTLTHAHAEMFEGKDLSHIWEDVLVWIRANPENCILAIVPRDTEDGESVTVFYEW